MDADHENMLDELLQDTSDAMTPWEVEFIESLHQRRDRGLSDKQGPILTRIWNKVFN